MTDPPPAPDARLQPADSGLAPKSGQRKGGPLLDEIKAAYLSANFAPNFAPTSRKPHRCLPGPLLPLPECSTAGHRIARWAWPTAFAPQNLAEVGGGPLIAPGSATPSSAMTSLLRALCPDPISPPAGEVSPASGCAGHQSQRPAAKSKIPSEAVPNIEENPSPGKGAPPPRAVADHRAGPLVAQARRLDR